MSLETAQPTHLQTIPVSEIKLGMVVHAIAEQAGSLGVKSKGRVTHLRIIKQLNAGGVKTVVVEQAPRKSTPISSLKKRKQTLLSAKETLIRETRVTPSKVPSDLHIEFAQASKLLKRSDKIFKSFSEKISQELEVDLSASKQMVKNIYENLLADPNALLCLSMMMDASDYLANHAVHTATLACYFGNYLGFSRHDCERLALIGYLFDIGMLKIDKRILEKSGQLSFDEQLAIQKHVGHSLKLLAPLKLDSESMLAIEQHHERLDGSGYPNGYSGSNIHKFSRIISIIDCYDALTANRPHKKPLSPAAAMKVLSNPDYGYDQKLVLQFIKCMGIFPVGSLVALSNRHIALVTKTKENAPTAPEVKVFYSIDNKAFVQPTFIDLSKQCDETGKALIHTLKILKPVHAAQYGLDMNQIV